MLTSSRLQYFPHIKIDSQPIAHNSKYQKWQPQRDIQTQIAMRSGCSGEARVLSQWMFQITSLSFKVCLKGFITAKWRWQRVLNRYESRLALILQPDLSLRKAFRISRQTQSQIKSRDTSVKSLIYTIKVIISTEIRQMDRKILIKCCTKLNFSTICFTPQYPCTSNNSARVATASTKGE